jgi:hypothetical protein
MKNETCQALTAADIKNQLAEREEYYDYCRKPPSEFLRDCFAYPEEWLDDWDGGSPAETSGKKSKRKERTHGGNGVLGVPVHGGRASCPGNDLAPNTNRGLPKYLSANPPLSKPLSAQDIYAMPEPETLQRGGYDGGCSVGFEGYWDGEPFAALLANLKRAQETAKETGSDAETLINGNGIYVPPTGANIGLFYSYIFKMGGVKFFIHQNPKQGMQAVRVQYEATALIGQDLFSVHRAVLDFLRSLGFTITDEKVSRVDMQVSVECKTRDFIVPIRTGYAICKARKYNEHGTLGRSVDTFTIGSINRVQICIYDKQKEFFEHFDKDPVKTALLVRYCFGERCLNNGVLTRIEFRLGRDALRDLGIDTVQDLQDKEAGLADYLPSEWLRLLKEPKVRGHENTAAVHPLWQEVQAAFKEWFPGTERNCRVEWNRHRNVVCNAEMLEKQAAGCLAKAAAVRFGKQKDKGTAQNIFRMLLDRYASPMFEKANDIANRLEVIKGCILGAGDSGGGSLQRFLRHRPPLVLQRQ